MSPPLPPTPTISSNGAYNNTPQPAFHVGSKAHTHILILYGVSLAAGRRPERTEIDHLHQGLAKAFQKQQIATIVGFVDCAVITASITFRRQPKITCKQRT